MEVLERKQRTREQTRSGIVTTAKDIARREGWQSVSIRKIAEAIRAPGGEQAVQLKVAEKAVEAFAQLAQKNNTMIIPAGMGEVSGLIATAMALSRSSVVRPS